MTSSNGTCPRRSIAGRTSFSTGVKAGSARGCPARPARRRGARCARCGARRRARSPPWPRCRGRGRRAAGCAAVERQAGSSMPGPPSSTRAARGPTTARTDTRRACRRGVGEHVAEQHVDGGRAFFAGEAHRVRAGRLDAAVPRPAVVVGQRAPERGALLDHLGEVAADRHLLVEGPAGGPDQLADLRLEAVDVVDQVGVAVALGVEPQRGERRAQAVGEVGDPLALGDASSSIRSARRLRARPRRRSPAGRPTSTRACGSPAGQRAAGARQVGRRAGELRARRSAATTATTRSTTATSARTSHGSPRPRRRASPGRAPAAPRRRRCRGPPGCTRRCRRRPTPRTRASAPGRAPRSRRRARSDRRSGCRRGGAPRSGRRPEACPRWPRSSSRGRVDRQDGGERGRSARHR